MISISTRLEEEKIKKIEQVARRMHLEKSALVRKFILDGLQMALLEYNLHAVQAGDMSLEQAAEDSEMSIYEVLEFARAKGFEIGLNEKSLDYELKSLIANLK